MVMKPAKSTPMMCCAQVTMPSCPSHAFVAFVSTDPETRQTPFGAIRLLELLLGAELVGVAALLLAL
jgi:hypothetical protein